MTRSELVRFEAKYVVDISGCWLWRGATYGSRTWREADLMAAMGYETKQSFRNAVKRALQACISIGIPHEENFILAGQEYRFTRFGCYLVALNGDPKKPGVAAAQAYFAKLADTFQSHMEHAEGVDRVLVRDEMTTGLKSLNHTAKAHGVENYAFFHDAGYRGLYNMGLRDLAQHKGLDPNKQKLLDYMGKTELAANLFRVTQTDEKIRNQGLSGQRQLENAAHSVGRAVRQTMQQTSGTAPERLPLAAPVQEVKRELKGANKKLRELDGKKKRKAQ